MRVVLVAFTAYPCKNGVAHVIHQHATYFARRGHEVIVITGASVPECDVKPEYTIIRFDVSGGPLITNRYRGDIQNYVSFVKSFHADMWFFHCWQIWTTDLVYMYNARPRSGRIVFVSHGAPVRNYKGSVRDAIRALLLEPYRQITMPRALHFFDDLVFLADLERSDRFADVSIAKAKRDPSSIHYIPNGFAETEEIAIPGVSGILQNGLRIVSYVANLDPIKDHESFIKILAHLPRDVVGVLAGGGTERRVDALKSRARSMGVLERIVFLGALTSGQVRWLFSRSQAQLFTSSSECYSLAALEASACGCPTIALDVGAMCRIPGVQVASNWSGQLSLLNKVMATQCDERARESLKRTTSTYSWQSVMEQYTREFGV